MGLKLYEETSVQAIADAIRAKNGSSDTYTISEMSTAIGNIPRGGGTHTETKTVTFLNTTTPFNVGDDFLSGYGVYSQDSSYALAIAVSDGVGFAARLHNGVVDGYSGSCTYSNGVFTFDSAFVQNYMGNSVYSLNCLFNDGEETTIINGEILTDNSFTDDFQAFTEGSMSNATTAGGKVNITWTGGTSIGYCRCGKTAYKNAKKVKVHIDYYGDSYGHQNTNNRNWNFAVFVTDVRLTSAITLTNLINDSHCLDYIECDNNQYYGQMNLDFEIDLSEITDAVYISYQSPGVTIQGLKITVVYEDESDLYKYHWSNDGKICVREEIGAVKWFFMGLTKDRDDIEVPTELASYLPDFEAPGQYMHAIAFTDPEGAWDGSHYIGFVYPGTANVKIRSWYSTSLGGGTFWGVLDITHYPFIGQQNEYVDPTDVDNALDVIGNCIVDTNHNLTGHRIEIVVPNSATSISSNVFKDCISLATITLPNSITSIGASAFRSCNNLTSITIPNSVISIGSYAFNNCSKMTTAVLPNSITSISDNIFAGCIRLASITIPNSVISIGVSAFTNCSSLASIILPDSITSIGNGAFSGCTGLTSISLPNNITSINSSTFISCSRLASITLPSMITSIGNNAFQNCSSLASITLPSMITSIGASAFYGCTGLATIMSENTTPPAISSSTFGNVPETCAIYVPAESVEAYKTAQYWSTRADYIQAIPE